MPSRRPHAARAHGTRPHHAAGGSAFPRRGSSSAYSARMRGTLDRVRQRGEAGQGLPPADNTRPDGAPIAGGGRQGAACHGLSCGLKPPALTRTGGRAARACPRPEPASCTPTPVQDPAHAGADALVARQRGEVFGDPGCRKVRCPARLRQCRFEGILPHCREEFHHVACRMNELDMLRHGLRFLQARKDVRGERVLRPPVPHRAGDPAPVHRGHLRPDRKA